MEYIYDKIIPNNLNEKDKQQIKIVLARYNNRLQKYKDIIYTAPPTRSFEENTNKVNEDTIKRTRGRPKKQYTEEEIEALQQTKRDIAKRHYENNMDKIKLQKTQWVQKHRTILNEKARVYRAMDKLKN